MCVGIECDGQTWNYKDDWKRLMEAVNEKKNRMRPQGTSVMLPFSQLDRKTLQPVSEVLRIDKNSWRDESDESAAKYRRGDSQDHTDLDLLITRHGEESLLAVVHADGNAMGARIQKLLGNATDYDTCINKMRRFSEKTEQVFVTEAEKVLNSIPVQKGIRPRILIKDGDDLTFVCNARDALNLTEAVLTRVAEQKDDDDKPFTSCAGICIFHSHYPFFMAYEMAEQACDFAKSHMRESAG